MREFTKGGIGYCIVEAEGKFEENLGVKGIDGKELVADTRFEPLKFIKPFGKVIQIPFALGERPLYPIPIGFPGYGAQRGDNANDVHAAIYAIGGVLKWRRMSDIIPEVEVGDTIWFSMYGINSQANLLDEYDRDGKRIFVIKIEYDIIYCVEKPEGPKMIGGWCFLDPMYENWEKILRPTFTDLKDPDGNPIPKPKDQWMMFAKTPPMRKFIAKLKHFGTPMRGDEFEFEKDDEVFIKPRKQQIMYKYKGTEYILLHMWDLLAKVVDEKLDAA